MNNIWRTLDPNIVRNVTVPDYMFHAAKKHIIYKVKCEMCPINPDENAYTVVFWCRFRTFAKLHTDLKLYYEQLHRKEPFPQFPDKHLFPGKCTDDTLKNRRQYIETFLQFICTKTYLLNSDRFINFIKSCSSDTIDEKSIEFKS
ncbi:hypothetical protein GJ496_004283 [Pomphorhynchus laevis]|nr:hypothetical protein GJ496_004283 [Pomphorhynchus laevis]